MDADFKNENRSIYTLLFEDFIASLEPQPPQTEPVLGEPSSRRESPPAKEPPKVGHCVGDSNEETKEPRSLRGLYNQGRTCYLNGILQTLFMTPLFRTQILKMNITQDDKILYELQVLFGMLQESRQAAVHTVDLTNSFGWDSNQVFVEQDAQEFCRILFNALSRYPPAKLLIDKVFGGVMADRLICCDCLNCRTRHDEFLDISLQIRGHSSLEAALHSFADTEILSESDKIFCSLCKSKTRAKKQLAFFTLPNCLMIHLKRFDYDLSTNSRTKLTHRVSFPFLLDMKHYCENSISPSSYHLYSILIHSGTANSGHYYCYVKHLVDGKWYCLNDYSVYPIQESDIEMVFGGPSSAYMLVYKKLEMNDIGDSSFSLGDSLISTISKKDEYDLSHPVQYQEQEMDITLTEESTSEIHTTTQNGQSNPFVGPPKPNEDKEIEVFLYTNIGACMKLICYQNDSLEDFLKKFCTENKINLPRDCLQLRRIVRISNTQKEWLAIPASESSLLTLKTLFPPDHIPELILNLKNPTDLPFSLYDLLIKFYLFQPSNHEFIEYIDIISSNSTLLETKRYLSMKLNVPSELLMLVHWPNAPLGEPHLVQEDNKTISQWSITTASLIILHCSSNQQDTDLAIIFHIIEEKKRAWNKEKEKNRVKETGVVIRM
eukprot:TRINITY_DN11178_c0_g1_i1.p1 TRINITY_DN11178_c0_g1~~TRINITY_DN11178_c0_g1_i1.p1  ORF type:complete len:745 (-),score=164.51 TRINITY_DN11178_c0_g1_i1:1939-3921(-)